jgi:hypothetical protein
MDLFIRLHWKKIATMGLATLLIFTMVIPWVKGRAGNSAMQNLRQVCQSFQDQESVGTTLGINPSNKGIMFGIGGYETKFIDALDRLTSANVTNATVVFLSVLISSTGHGEPEDSTRQKFDSFCSQNF